MYDTKDIPTVTDIVAAQQERAKQVPEPTGYRLLLKPLTVKQKTEGGIIRPDELVGREEVASVVALVMKVGPDAYADKTRFPGGPWCKEGDFVIVRSYSGTRFKIHGHEFRIINDDGIEAVVEDPRGIERV